VNRQRPTPRPRGACRHGARPAHWCPPCDWSDYRHAQHKIAPYASRTGTKINLEELHRTGWRLLVSARGVMRTEGFRYAIDNGAWTSFTKGQPFDFKAFEKVVSLLGDDADFIVLPDIVEGGLWSLQMSLEWIPRLQGVGERRLLAVQDGMTPAHVAPYLGPDLGIAVGGSDEWKLSSLAVWGQLARDAGCYLHVLRVNSQKRIRLSHAAGAHSFDGSGPSRWLKHIHQLNRGLAKL